MFDIKKLEKIMANGVVAFWILARKMGVSRYQNQAFSKFLNELLAKGVIATTKEKDYFIPQITKEIQGTIRVNAKGFGFIDDEEQAIFVPFPHVNSALDGDEVLVKIFRDPADAQALQGIVSKIVTRNIVNFVGTVKKFNGYFGIMPFNKNIGGIFKFKNDAGLEVDDEVKVRIIKYGHPIVIDVIKKLGKTSDVAMDILVAIEDADVAHEFNHEVQAEAKAIPQAVSLEDQTRRRDLRDRLIVTIDGDDTKDFDDAIEVQKLPNGNYKLAVHIADVAHYVRANTALDNEAQLRGTSIYLPDRVIPMLPPPLSNGICSLNSSVDRLTMTAAMEIDKQGQTVNYEIYPSVINCKFRLTYQEVNKYYRKRFFWNHNHLEQMLNDALELSQIMRQFKEQAGYIDFEIEESKIITSKQGKTTRIVAKDRLESEMMIEDFMVRANETVAHFVEKKQLPFIYRVHDKPDITKVQNLQGIVTTLGMNISIPHSAVPAEFARSIQQIKATRFDDFMKIMMLRTMQKAIYSPINIGHFGLASKSYTHFTSPIRRYPDLMVHRLLKAYFFNNAKGATPHLQASLAGIAKHASEREQKAMNLERKVVDMKKAEFYEQYIGQVFSGVIVSMMKFGFFVQFPNKVDGLVHVSSLSNGVYKLVDGGYALANGQRKFTIGDKVKVLVIGVSKSEGKINLAIAGSSGAK